MTEKLKNQGTPNHEAIPDDVVDTLARCLLPKIQAYFNSPEGQAEFEEWKRRQANDWHTKRPYPLDRAAFL